jgi:hypothetical protein
VFDVRTIKDIVIEKAQNRKKGKRAKENETELMGAKTGKKGQENEVIKEEEEK